LFVLGKLAIGFYLSSPSAATTLGAGGAVIGLLLWVYYSSMILLYGAAVMAAWRNDQQFYDRNHPRRSYSTPILTDRIFGMDRYQDYYNATRTHLGIGKDSPDHRPFQALGAIVAVPLLGGLHHRYARI